MTPELGTRLEQKENGGLRLAGLSLMLAGAIQGRDRRRLARQVPTNLGAKDP